MILAVAIQALISTLCTYGPSKWATDLLANSCDFLKVCNHGSSKKNALDYSLDVTRTRAAPDGRRFVLRNYGRTCYS